VIHQHETSGDQDTARHEEKKKPKLGRKEIVGHVHPLTFFLAQASHRKFSCSSLTGQSVEMEHSIEKTMAKGK
jgi:metallophosphoesterase superfamily enzyme